VEATSEHTADAQAVQNDLAAADQENTSQASESEAKKSSQVTAVSGEKPVQRLAPEEVCDLEPREPVEISLRGLLQAGVHYGHQTSRWNPKMAQYIHSVRNGIHIINLPKTIQCWEAARKEIIRITSKGGQVLFVGTKKQAQDAIVEEARRCGAYYVSRRWLGGMMTNFQTVRKSIERMKKLEAQLAEDEQILREGGTPKFKKKERLMMSRELDKLLFSLSGIREMYRVPDLVFVIDIKREDIAVNEANRLDIPVIALVDTNCDPADVTFPVPSNDDGSRALRLFAAAVSDAVNEGKKLYVPKPQKREDKSVQRGSAKKGHQKATKAQAAPAKAEEQSSAPVADPKKEEEVAETSEK
jgi:small subunit ribosomal protein S2